MKRFGIVFYLLLLFPICCFSQQDCDKKTLLDADLKLVPKDVCIRKEYVINYIYSKYNCTDFNKDGLTDFVFSMRKKEKTIGDTTFLVFYKMNIDSSYTLIKCFDNIIPIYFDPNVEVPNLKNENLHRIFQCYSIPNPLNHVEITDDKIEMIVNFDDHFYESITYQYVFDSTKNDWILIEKIYYQGDMGKHLSIKLNDKLSKFSYCNQTME